MTKIIPKSVTTVTHLTSLGEDLVKKFKKELVFNPFLT